MTRGDIVGRATRRNFARRLRYRTNPLAWQPRVSPEHHVHALALVTRVSGDHCRNRMNLAEVVTGRASSGEVLARRGQP